LKEKFLKLLREHTFAFIGCAAGLLLALLMMLVGFWGTLLLALLGGVGLWLGISLDKGKDIGQMLYGAAMKIKRFFSALFGGRR